MNPRIYLLLSITLIFTKPSIAQTTGVAVSETDTLIQSMSATEEMYLKQIDYYQVHLNKNGRKMKTTGYDNKIGSDNLNYPFIVSQDKTSLKKKGAKIRKVRYFSYNTAAFKDLTILKNSKILAFSKTEINDKTISAKYILPDRTVMYVLNGRYYKSNNKSKKFNAYIYK